MNKKRLIMFYISSLLIVISIAVTYAYFTSNITGSESSTSINARGGVMSINYDGGAYISLNGIYPSDTEWATKTFTVTGKNTTNLSMYYNLYLIVESNSFNNNELAYTLSSNDEYDGIINNIDLTYLDSDMSYVLGQGSFEKTTNEVHTYTLKMYYPNKLVEQNINQGASFNGYVKVEEVPDNKTFMVNYKVGDTIIYSETVARGKGVKNIPEITSIPDNGNFNKMWSNDGTNIISDITIYPRYYYTLTFTSTKDNTIDMADLSTYSYKLYSDNLTLTFDNFNIYSNGMIINTATLKSDYKDNQTNNWKINGSDYYKNQTYEVNSDTDILFYSYSGCVAYNTKIDVVGGTKLVQDVKKGDMVLSYNFFTGNIEQAEVLSVTAGDANVNVLTVSLDNGSKLRIVDEENLFDVDDRKYIPINMNTYNDYIGKNVLVNNNGVKSSAKIIDIKVSQEHIKHYTMYTKNNINYIAEGIIALAPNYYENMLYVIKNDLTIDQDILNEEIKKYGLFKYDDFSDILSKENFDAWNIQYYKIMVNKLNISLDEFRNSLKVLQDEFDNNDLVNKSS